MKLERMATLVGDLKHSHAVQRELFRLGGTHAVLYKDSGRTQVVDFENTIIGINENGNIYIMNSTDDIGYEKIVSLEQLQAMPTPKKKVEKTVERWVSNTFIEMLEFDTKCHDWVIPDCQNKDKNGPFNKKIKITYEVENG